MTGNGGDAPKHIRQMLWCNQTSRVLTSLSDLAGEMGEVKKVQKDLINLLSEQNSSLGTVIMEPENEVWMYARHIANTHAIPWLLIAPQSNKVVANIAALKNGAWLIIDPEELYSSVVFPNMTAILEGVKASHIKKHTFPGSYFFKWAYSIAAKAYYTLEKAASERELSELEVRQFGIHKAALNGYYIFLLGRQEDRRVLTFAEECALGILRNMFDARMSYEDAVAVEYTA